MTSYFIGKDKYLHYVTEYSARGEPQSSKRVPPKEVEFKAYMLAYMQYFGFRNITTEEQAKERAPFTVQFLEAQYETLYLKKDIEIDEDVLFKSLREVGRAQKELTKPK